MIRYFLLMLVLAMMVSACATRDLQGVDPKDFYTEHPVKNTVETRHMLYTLDFSIDKNRLMGDDIDDFQSAVRDISPEAVESVVVKLSPSQMNNEARRQHITKLLRVMGYKTRAIMFESSKETHVREAQLDISYASVVLPHCPDWRTSPVTTYSNTQQANFGCASAVNLGLQVADPRDLEQGSGDPTPDSERNSAVIRAYKTGTPSATTSSSSSSSSSSDNSTGSAGASGAQ
jgi:pilus biogenesis lipoprotein CpaD